jgi:hypothetical protein
MNDISVQGSYNLGLQQLKDEIVAKDREIEQLRLRVKFLVDERKCLNGDHQWRRPDWMTVEWKRCQVCGVIARAALAGKDTT